MFETKTLLITGGTGSFGGAVLNRFINSDFKEIRIFSRDEKKQDDLRKQLESPKVKFYIGDVRDIQSIRPAIANVDYVFHAAALKQVPSCEFFPLEAVKTNILGTENLLQAALDAKVKKCVILSTDKAVYPINAMGMSKALMEKVMIAKSRQLTSPEDTLLCGTRYGNVMASRGSVIPLFVEQLKAKKTITVTDATMTRFMMSLEDAVDLVLYAFQNGRQGDMFVQKAPAATVEVLVEALAEIFSIKNPSVKIIGTRHGEKKHETLLNREELIRADDLGQYYRIKDDDRGLDSSVYFNSGETKLSLQYDYTSEVTHRLNKSELIELLLKLDYIKSELGTK